MTPTIGVFRTSQEDHVKARLRTIHFGGRTFTWTADIGHVKGSGDCHRTIRVRAWADGKNSRALQVDLLSTGWGSPWGACTTDNSHPTSSDIHLILTYALEHGWQPELRGGTWLLTERDHAPQLELPGFLITDRVARADAPDPTARVMEVDQRRTATV
jgi:hypothetical protein